MTDQLSHPEALPSILQQVSHPLLRDTLWGAIQSDQRSLGAASPNLSTKDRGGEPAGGRDSVLFNVTNQQTSQTTQRAASAPSAAQPTLSPFVLRVCPFSVPWGGYPEVGCLQPHDRAALVYLAQ